MLAQIFGECRENQIFRCEQLKIWYLLGRNDLSEMRPRCDCLEYHKGEPACGRMPYEPRFLMIRENAGGVYMAGKEADERSQYTGRKRSAAL